VPSRTRYLIMWNWLSLWLRRLTNSGPSVDPAIGIENSMDDAIENQSGNRPDLTVQPDRFPFDDGLLDRARQLWQFGEWAQLALLIQEDIEQHPERAKLALLAASGLSQMGDKELSLHWFKQAKKWGCAPKLLKQIMISGVENNLAQAALFAGQAERAQQWMASGIHTVMPHLDSQLLAKSRLSVQHQKIDFAVQNFAEELSLAKYSGTEVDSAPDEIEPDRGFNPHLVASFDLGEAWAGNTVNTVIFRHHGIFTHQGHQFTSFYVDEKTLRFVCRRLSDDHITQHDLVGEYNLKDAHNSISMGVDREGYLHACFDHHATKLRYRRSLKPMSIDGWTNDLPMTGQHEDKVTYPTFILPRADYPLTLLYRDGVHNKGSARLKFYNEKSQNWQDKSTPILSGSDQKPWTSNAYWNHPAIGTDGSLHLSFVWRTGVLGDEQLVNNINIGYAWSPDNGHHWYTLQGQPYQVPITPTTAETIWPVPPGSNLINQCSMALDQFNRPHIVFYANDTKGIPQYQHLRYDGKQWHHQILSHRTTPFNLAGGGTLQIPISRPEILIDAQDNALVLFRGDLTGDRMAVMRLCAPTYLAGETSQHILIDQSSGYAEPMLDRSGWALNQKLSLLKQYNAQPDHDVNPTFTSSSVELLQFDF
jgi:hypothetical protein